MERDRHRTLSTIVSIGAIVLLLPALVFFIDQAVIDGSSSARTTSSESSIDLVDLGHDGLLESGAGTCTPVGDGLRVEGRGVTSCRNQEWIETPMEDLTVSLMIAGLHEGATAVLRFRESDGERVEIAIGRSRIELRERRVDRWVVLAEVARTTVDSGTMETIETAALPFGRVDDVEVRLTGDLVELWLGATPVATARTSVVTPGEFSLGAVLRESVAIGFAAIEFSETR